MINPNIFGDPSVPGSYRKARVPSINLGLGALAAYIEAKSQHKVSIIDARFEGLDPDGALKKLYDLEPHIVGVSLCSHESTTWTIPFLRFVKKWKPSIHTTLGNHFASLFPQKALEQIKQRKTLTKKFSRLQQPILLCGFQFPFISFKTNNHLLSMG